jgi:hypothetical protein
MSPQGFLARFFPGSRLTAKPIQLIRKTRLGFDALEDRVVPTGLPALHMTASSISMVAEGDTTETFTMVRTGGDLAHGLSAYVSVGDGGGLHAVQGSDYSVGTTSYPTTLPSGGGNVGFAAGSDTLTFTINCRRDNLVDPGKAFQVTLLPNAAYTIDGANATVVPLGDDPPVVTISSTQAITPGANGTLTLTRSGGDVTKAMTGYITITDASGLAHARQNLDYKVTGPSGTVPYGGGNIGFAAGAATATINIQDLLTGATTPVEGLDVSVNNYTPAIYDVGSPSIAIIQLSNGTVGSTTTVTSTSPNPSLYGQALSYVAQIATAGISASAATGTIQFTVNGVPQGAPVSVVNGMASWSPPSVMPASSSRYAIGASYSGDSTYSTSAGWSYQTINAAATTTDLALQQDATTANQVDLSITVTNTQTAPPPVGTLSVTMDGTTLSATLSGSVGSVSTWLLSVPVEFGGHTFQAILSPTTDFLSSQSAPQSIYRHSAPIGTDGQVTSNEDTAYAFSAADFGFTDSNDVPADSFTGVLISTLPTYGVLTLSGSTVGQGDLIPIGSIISGNLAFTPRANESGSAYDMVMFQVQDGGSAAYGGATTDPTPRTLAINVTPVNDAPVAADDSVSTGAEQEIDGFASATDVDGDPLTFAVQTSPAHGVLTLNSDGSFAFQPATGFSGSDSFQFSASDGSLSSVASILVNVLPIVSITESGPDASTVTGASAQFIVSRTGDLTQSLSVTYAVSGTALNGTDYQTLTGAVTIPAGSATAPVDLIPNTSGGIEEADTTSCQLTLQSISTYYVSTLTSTATAVIDNPPAPLVLTVERINQDDPASTQWIGMGAVPIAYAGSIASTSDNLRVTVAVQTPNPNNPITNIQWTSNFVQYPAPAANANATTWNLGDLAASTGGHNLVLTVTVTFQDGTVIRQNTGVELGIRTDDYTVVGWINPNGVTLVPAGVRAGILNDFPVNGQAGIGAAGDLAALAQLSPGQATWLGPVALNQAERTYLLNWLIKWGGQTMANGNPITPPNDFQTAAGIMDYSKLQTFIDSVQKYKLVNHLQLDYRVDMTNLVNGVATHFNGNPQQLNNSQAYIGTTLDPLTRIVTFPGQTGPQNNNFRVLSNDPSLPAQTDSASQINDGSPDANGVKVLDELMGDPRNLDANGRPATPMFWENIGSRIEFDPRNGTTGSVFVQPYPTYFVYVNGVQTANPFLQAPSAAANFVAIANGKGSYPFGTQPSTAAGNQGPLSIPGGNNGLASRRTLSARTPPSMVYLQADGTKYGP